MFICYKHIEHVFIMKNQFKKIKGVCCILLITELHDGVNISVKKPSHDVMMRNENVKTVLAMRRKNVPHAVRAKRAKNVCEREFFKVKKV